MVTRWQVTKAVRASDLPAPSRLIMLTLADVAEVGTAEIPERFTPSLSVLARETGLGRSTVAIHLRSLERDGWIVRSRPTTAEALGRGERTQYHLQVSSTVPSPAVDLVQEPTSPAPEQPSPAPEQPSAGAGHRVRSTSDQGQISGPRKRGTRLPEDFTVTPEMRKWAQEHVPQLAGKRETEKFIDHWRSASGQNAVKRDWVAAWRNWMRNAVDRYPGRSAQLPASSAPVPLAAAEQCPEHRGQRKGACRYCAADAKARVAS